MAHTPKELLMIAATAADSKKAEDIVALQLEGISDIADYFLICTANNNPHMDSILEEIREKIFKNTGEKPFSSEGKAGMDWVLLDYGSLVVHIFKPEAREFYRLEQLWGDAKQLDLELDA